MTAQIAIRLSGENFEVGKAAIDFVLHLPDSISHNAEGGYQQILDTITDGIQHLATSGHLWMALELAEYALISSLSAMIKLRIMYCVRSLTRDWYVQYTVECA